MSDTKHHERIVILNAQDSRSEKRVNAFLEKGWFLKKVEPMSAASGAGGGNGVNFSGANGFAVAVLGWEGSGSPPKVDES
jgi:hypothetical protein